MSAVVKASRKVSAPLLLTAVFLALTLPVIAVQRGGTGAALDQEVYHLPTIEAFAAELPSPDLEEANVAMGPLFHLTLAPVARFVSDERPVLLAFALVFSLGAVLAAYFVVVRLVESRLALALVLPLACSHYVVQSAGWLNTDNMALLFAVVVLAGCLGLAGDRAWPWLVGVAALLCVWTRQSYAWLVGVILLTGAFAFTAGGEPTARRTALAATPPVVGLIALVVVWGGLAPPRFKGDVEPSPEVFAFTLALFGLFAVPYLIAANQSIAKMLVAVVRDRGSAVAAALGAATALAPVPSKAIEEGFTGGALWLTVNKAPLIAGVSPLLVLLAAWGALVALRWYRLHRDAGRLREGVLILTALFGVALAHAAKIHVLHKYFEPLVLVLLALLAALALADDWPERSERSRRVAFAALGALVAIQLLGVSLEVYGEMSQSPPIDQAYGDLKDGAR
ncbi:MAG TPA: hypothetical protein VHG69_09640 [Thermoleophilaceae bacterium]|nr:hypothetical protein [Thermoleophilaceae bacterium]